MKLSEKEYRKYFWDGDTFSAIPYIVETVTEMLYGVYDMKYCDKGKWWYGEWEGHRRKVVHLFAQKGGARILCWGWNYGYIPHVSRTDKVTYARTEKAFSLDIDDNYWFHVDCDPDKMSNEEIYNLHRQYDLPSETSNADVAREYIYDICNENVAFIKEYFDKTRTDEDTLSELERQKKEKPWLFLYSNEAYVRAFILAKHGRKDEAEHIILHEYYSEGKYNEKVLALLRNLAEND